MKSKSMIFLVRWGLRRNVLNSLALSVALLLQGGLTSNAAEERDLVLVAGQSNAVGFDAYAEQLPADPSDTRVMFWWRAGDPPPDEHDSTSARQWTHLQVQPKGNPIPRTAPSEQAPAEGLKRQYGNFKSKDGGFGPEMGFAREWSGRQGRALAIVKAAFSGTGMSTDWNSADPGPAGACYRALVSEAREAIAEASKKGVRLRPRALLWVQGENYAKRIHAPDYERLLGAMLGKLREELGAPEMPAFLAVNTHFGNDKNPFVARVVEAQKALAANPSNRAVYVDTDGAQTLLPTQTHFTAEGTLEVGRRFAKALGEWEKLHPQP
ncbi:MAG: Arylsulfatase precursor [Verrucomicrobiota bacterium]